MERWPRKNLMKITVIYRNKTEHNNEAEQVR